MKYSLLVIAIYCLGQFSCKNNKKNPSDSSSQNSSDYSSNTSAADQNEENNKYPDGDYCATVTYYNPNTSTTSTYHLTVEIESGELTQINWPNGGWTDDSHFVPEEVDESGIVNFTTDKGYNYEIQLEGRGPCSYSTQSAVSPEEEERKHVGEDEGVVIWDHFGCDYVIIESGLWYVVAEKRTGAYSLGVGKRVRGELIGFGFEDVYDFSGDDEISLYIDNYYGTKSRAIEKVMEKCDLVNEDY